jgi:hypothetical protein
MNILTRLSSYLQQGLHVASKAQLLEDPVSHGALFTTKVGVPSQYFRASSMNSFVANRFLDGNTLIDNTSLPIHVYGCVYPILQPIHLHTRLI